MTTTPPAEGQPKFRTAMDFAYGEPKEVAPGVRRIVAENPSPYTFKGTNTYIVGRSDLVVIDPGPDLPAHRTAILKAIGGRPVRALLITHTHRDHIDGLAALKAETGAPAAGFGRSGGYSDEAGGSVARMAIQPDFAPEIRLTTGSEVAFDDMTLTAIHTPGHAPDHLCFALTDHGMPTGILFSGDHVMAWNTTVVAPPEGHMGDYIAALERLSARSDRLYLPGHGGRLEDPQRMVRAYLVHRRWREDAILAVIREGAGKNEPASIETIVTRVYQGLDPRLTGAAALSVEAHVRHLGELGLVRFGQPLHSREPLWPVSR